MNRIIGKLEEMRMRNLQMGRNMLNHRGHWTDDEISSKMIQMHEDLTLIAHTLKRLISPFEDQ